MNAPEGTSARGTRRSETMSITAKGRVEPSAATSRQTIWRGQVGLRVDDRDLLDPGRVGQSLDGQHDAIGLPAGEGDLGHVRLFGNRERVAVERDRVDHVCAAARERGARRAGDHGRLLRKVVAHGPRLDERLGDDPSEHLLRPARPPVLEIEPAGAGRLPERPRLGRTDALDQREDDVVVGQRCVCLCRNVQPAERSDDEERDRDRSCGSDTREREPGPDGRTSAAIRAHARLHDPGLQAGEHALDLGLRHLEPRRLGRLLEQGRERGGLAVATLLAVENAGEAPGQLALRRLHGCPPVRASRGARARHAA